MARSQPQISSGVTNDPGRRDRRASRKLFDTLCAVLHSLTRTKNLHSLSPCLFSFSLVLPLSLSLSLFIFLCLSFTRVHSITVSIYLVVERACNTHASFHVFESPAGARDANLYWNFSLAERCLGFDRTQETVKPHRRRACSRDKAITRYGNRRIALYLIPWHTARPARRVFLSFELFLDGIAHQGIFPPIQNPWKRHLSQRCLCTREYRCYAASSCAYAATDSYAIPDLRSCNVSIFDDLQFFCRLSDYPQLFVFYSKLAIRFLHDRFA